MHALVNMQRKNKHYYYVFLYLTWWTSGLIVILPVAPDTLLQRRWSRDRQRPENDMIRSFHIREAVAARPVGLGGAERREGVVRAPLGLVGRRREVERPFVLLRVRFVVGLASCGIVVVIRFRFRILPSRLDQSVSAGSNLCYWGPI
jgi:hypothetical protein